MTFPWSNYIYIFTMRKLQGGDKSGINLTMRIKNRFLNNFWEVARKKHDEDIYFQSWYPTGLRTSGILCFNFILCIFTAILILFRQCQFRFKSQFEASTSLTVRFNCQQQRRRQVNFQLRNIHTQKKTFTVRFNCQQQRRRQVNFPPRFSPRMPKITSQQSLGKQDAQN